MRGAKDSPPGERHRLADTLDGFPQGVLSDAGLLDLSRFVLDLDALGRIEASGGEPLIEEHILRSLLSAFAGAQTSGELVDALARLPSHRLRRPDNQELFPEELTWFELGERVVVYDPEPAGSIADLDLQPGVSVEETMRAVNCRLPGLELELLDPAVVPERLNRARGNGEWEPMLAQACRHLGWWAALAGALLASPASLALGVGGDAERDSAAKIWPLAMYLLGLTIGDWTMTVVCGCLLAPATAASAS